MSQHPLLVREILLCPFDAFFSFLELTQVHSLLHNDTKIRYSPPFESTQQNPLGLAMKSAIMFWESTHIEDDIEIENQSPLNLSNNSHLKITISISLNYLLQGYSSLKGRVIRYFTTELADRPTFNHN